jgi:MFS family permease
MKTADSPIQANGKSGSAFQFWIMIWGLGLAGHLAWNLENGWFNTFVYAKIAKDSNIVAAMVMTSALVTTFSTFFFGTLSDRLGSRRVILSVGYIIWGVFTICFGLTEFIGSGTVGTGTKLGMLAAVLVVLADDFMSFFGSMGYDSAYNAWANDCTNDRNRGQIGAALAVLPVIGTIIGTVLGGLLIGSDDNYQRLFWVMGIFVILMGFVSLVFMRDAPTLAPYRESSFRKQFFAVFNFKKFFAQKELALCCLLALFFFIPFNVFFVHIGNWMIYRLGFTADKLGIVQGVGLILAMLLSIPAAFLINRRRLPVVAAAAIVLNVAGLWLLFFLVRPGSVHPAALFSAANFSLFAGMFFVGGGFILITQALGMWIKALYPPESRGQCEGIRCVCFTLVPMVVGTVIGNEVVKRGAGTIVNDYGITENIPTETIFLCAAILSILCVVPLFAASRLYYQRVKQ